MSVLFIADLHLGHESMAVKRGFEDAEAMFQHLKAKWNAKVHKRDLVYILGDVAMENSKHYHLLKELKGLKYVVLGNHDMRKDVIELQKYVDGIAGMVKYKGIFLTHCPIHPMELGYRVSRNIHGHLHENVVYVSGMPDPRYIGVSCEQVDYTPKYFDELIKR